MKTKELIRRLQELDPSGEEHVGIGNADIQTIDRLPAYYDGYAQSLTLDEEDCVISAAYLAKGTKICLRSLSIPDAIWYEWDDRKRMLPVDYSDLGPTTAARIKAENETIPGQVDKMNKEIEWPAFVKWIEHKSGGQMCHFGDEIKQFFDEKVWGLELPEAELKTEMRDGIEVKYYDSPYNRRQAMWESRLDVSVFDQVITIKEKE